MLMQILEKINQGKILINVKLMQMIYVHNKVSVPLKINKLYNKFQNNKLRMIILNLKLFNYMVNIILKIYKQIKFNIKLLLLVKLL